MNWVDLEIHWPYIAGGAILGLLAFSPLLLALIPVLRKKRDASLAKGLLGIGISFVILFLGVVVVQLLSPGALIAFLVGELLGFFVCWIVLAVYVMAGR